MVVASHGRLYARKLLVVLTVESGPPFALKLVLGHSFEVLLSVCVAVF